MFKTIISVIFIFLFVTHIQPTRVVHAIGDKGVGERCESTQECGLHMGCRQSQLGDYKVCKIAVPGVAGCAAETTEPLCGKGMGCKDDRCILTFGFEDEQGDGDQVQEDQNIFNFDRLVFAVKEFFAGSLFRKIISLLLAALFLVGCLCIVKGRLVYLNATGLIPEQRRGNVLMGVGVACVIGSIVLWLVYMRM